MMFENIIGNDKIKELLLNSINLGKTSHSYLFIGIEGIGKRIIAKEFAKNVLCNSKQKDCNNCKSCIEFKTNNHPDFKIIEPDGNSIKIEQIRYMQKKIQEKPIISAKKVYIINDSDKMTKEAQNCLLKTLEEPPEYAIIILIGANESNFLSTIKSRCMILRFSKIENNELKDFIESKFQIKNIDENILEMYQGSIGKASSSINKIELYTQIKEIINSLEYRDIIDIINMSNIIYKSKENIFEILEYINVLLIKKAKNNFKYTNCIEIVENTKKRLNQNANYDMCIDNMLFNIYEQIT